MNPTQRHLAARNETHRGYIGWLSLIGALWLAAYVGAAHRLENTFRPKKPPTPASHG